MRAFAVLVALVVCAVPTLGATDKRIPATRSYATHDYYILEHNPAAAASIEECTHALNVQLVEQVGELKNHWLVRAQAPDLLSRRTDSDAVLARFAALQERASSHPLESRSFTDAHRVTSSIRSLDRQVPRQRVKKRAPLPEPIPAPVEQSKISRISSALGIKDPQFPKQWHLINEAFPQYDLNVSGVWQSGVTGKGVHVAVVDDGLDANSDDLAPNFDAEGSWDYNDNTALPLPRLSDDTHGTRCCGEISAAKNDVCGVGVAYNSKIAGVRILSGAISDADEAAALNYGYHKTSIYSCSWGPPDDGKSMEAPNFIIQKAVVNGIQNGREGKGSIFVFASGNGGGSGDQCNFDGYTNSIYSVTVAAVDHEGKHPYYSEACAANLIVAYSSGGNERIYTTDVGKNQCTNAHGGTSAAAPLAAGVIALGLEVRPELTWRDVQHIALRSAQHIQPDDPDWETTASGRKYSYKYGYGALDAWTFVELARTWKLVKPQAWIDLGPVRADGLTEKVDQSWWDKMEGGVAIPKGGLESKLHITKEGMTQHNFERLEHITVSVWITHGKRGDVAVEITSPNGIVSVLAAPRRFDEHTSGFPGWTFMSVKHWGEDPVGAWTIRVKDQNSEEHNGTFLGWSMTLWGESIDAAKTKLWTFPAGSNPDEAQNNASTATVTATPAVTPAPSKTRPKPTDHLPTDHVSAGGEAHQPAFGNHTTPSNSTLPSVDDSASHLDNGNSSADSDSASKPSASVTPDEGYFSHMSDLLSSSNWLFGAIGAVAIFGLLAGVFFWRRGVARRKRSAEYAAVGGGEDHPMATVGGAGGAGLGGADQGAASRLLGSKGDDDSDDEDEEVDGLHRGGPNSPGLRYHDGFLDDDALESANSLRAGAGAYRDDVEEEDRGRIARREEGGENASPSGRSGTGSWEHASTDVTPTR